MLELRPNCEACDRDLPPDSKEAMICSFECTFCSTCVAQVLMNVCPNCGGGLWPRPVRPREKLTTRPASTQRVVKPLDPEAHTRFAAPIKDIPPAER